VAEGAFELEFFVWVAFLGVKVRLIWPDGIEPCPWLDPSPFYISVLLNQWTHEPYNLICPPDFKPIEFDGFKIRTGQTPTQPQYFPYITVWNPFDHIPGIQPPS
jgi:hypothetical protein